MHFLAVSTFNAEGLAKYGRRMMDSFHRHWPDTVPLRVYSEGWRHEGPEAYVTDLIEASPWLAAFKARHAHRQVTGYRLDAVRFSHKVAALCHAARTSSADVLIWLDGDTLTHANLTEAALIDLAPKGDEWIAWLDRARKYPECGFYMLNCRHPRHEEMMGAFEAMYRDDGLFALPEWHDSFVLQEVVRVAGIKTKSLSGAGRNTMHPLVNGPVGKFCDHLKGKRKDVGKSLPTDMARPRSEEYWRQ